MTDMARTFRRIAHVANDPNVLSGRAVQEAFGRRWLMRSCINVFGLRLEHVLRAIMDISAHAIFLADRPRQGLSGHQGSHAPGRPILHRPHSLAELGGLRVLIMSSKPP